MIKKTVFCILCITGFAISSCTTVKGYERVYLNDEEMELDIRKCAHHEAYFQVIREGASGANGGKTGGGCGCN